MATILSETNSACRNVFSFEQAFHSILTLLPSANTTASTRSPELSHTGQHRTLPQSGLMESFCGQIWSWGPSCFAWMLWVTCSFIYCWCIVCRQSQECPYWSNWSACIMGLASNFSFSDLWDEPTLFQTETTSPAWMRCIQCLRQVCEIPPWPFEERSIIWIRTPSPLNTLPPLLSSLMALCL